MQRVEHPTPPLESVELSAATGGHYWVVCRFRSLLPGPFQRAFLAIDASRSMLAEYGDRIFGGPNRVQIVVRKLAALLCDLCTDGTVDLLYWALDGGSALESIGRFDAEGCRSLNIAGPNRHKWGKGTQLLPVLDHMFQRSREGLGLGVIVTDGVIEDERECLQSAYREGKAMHEGRRPWTRFVILALGDEIDDPQLERFDDAFEHTDLQGEVDLFEHVRVADLCDEQQLLAWLAPPCDWAEPVLAAEWGRVLDDRGRTIHEFQDGVPPMIRFSLPQTAQGFTLQIDGQTILQDLSAVLGPQASSAEILS